MKTYTPEELKAVLAEHVKWLRGEGVSRANLTGANLRDADLTGADLSGANLRYANLRYANLRDANLRDADLIGANLRDANLIGADLSGANLRYANLRYANLRDANLRDADLTGANLIGANLIGADLSYANLRDADLRDADLSNAKNIPSFQICEGDLIVYKKVEGKIVTLAIPKDAKRTASIVGRKCRSEYALVLEIEGHEPVISNGCGNGVSTLYQEGKEVLSDSYDDDWSVECSHGIHWFLTRKEAEDWTT
jgi:hypothetical protein